MAWCLTKTAEKNLREALRKDGDPQKMVDRGTEGRLAWFTKHVGAENAERLNYLFETKMLLKSQQRGFESFVKYMGGSKEVKRDFLTKVGRVEKALSNTEVEQYLETYVSQRLGVSVSEAEYKKIVDLSEKARIVAEAYDLPKVAQLTKAEGIELMKDPKKNKVRLKYGDAVIALDNYATELKLAPKKASLERFKKASISEKVALTKQGAKTAIDLSKSMNASYDNSAILNQGFPVLSNLRTARIWKKNAVDTFVNIVKTFKGKPVMDKIRADVVSRPNYINGSYKKAKLAINVTEEDFPSDLPEKLVDFGKKGKKTDIVTAPIRLFGKGFKASNVVFSGFQLRNRVDVFDLFSAMAEKSGEGTEGLGKFVNALTARGRLGAAEPAANIINAPFFSLRKQAAAVESLFFYQIGKQDSFTRKRGAEAAIQQIALIALILAVSKAIDPDSVEEDNTSADYGKIKVGSSRFDPTQGRAAFFVLAMRILKEKYTSSTTGNVIEINSDEYNSMAATDLIGDFTQNKFSPFLNNLIYMINRKNREGERPTITSTFIDLYAPIGAKDIPELLNDPESANFIAVTLANFFGVQTNTYSNANIKSNIIPTDTMYAEDDFLSRVKLGSLAFSTDPIRAFSIMFTGQKIMKVGSGIIVVNRDDVKDSQAWKKQWIKDNPEEARKFGATVENMKEVKKDHTVPLGLGGNELNSNAEMVSTSVHSAYTPVETALIRAVKADKVSVKEAQKIIKNWKKDYTPTESNNKTLKDLKEEGAKIIDRFKKEVSKIKIVKEAYAAEEGLEMTKDERKKFDIFNDQIKKYEDIIEKRKSSKLLSPEPPKIMVKRKKDLEKKKEDFVEEIKTVDKVKTYFEGYKAPLAKYAKDYVRISKEYNLDYRVPVVISFLESTGGKNITRKNNPANLGARFGQTYDTMEEGIRAVISAIGGRKGTTNNGKAWTKTQLRTSSYYEKYRETITEDKPEGDLRVLAQIYEPDPAKRDKYVKDLIKELNKL